MNTNIDSENISDELINKYLSGFASEEELETLVKWLETSAENARYFAELSYVHSAYKTITSPTLHKEKDAMLLRINERIDAEISLKKQNKSYFSTAFKFFSTIAAAIVILLAYFFFIERPNENIQEEKYLTYSNTSTEIVALGLEDGTKVWLHGGSLLQQNLDSKDGIRKIKLSGRAYFDVAKDSTHPFIVTTDAVAVKVLGTRFSVETSNDGSKVKVVLENGSIRLQSLEGVNLVRLHPNQVAIYDGLEDDVFIEPINAKPYLVEHYNKITLNQVCIPEIIKHIYEMYGVTISTPQKYDPKLEYELNYNRTDSVEQVIDIICVLTGVKFEIDR